MSNSEQNGRRIMEDRREIKTNPITNSIKNLITNSITNLIRNSISNLIKNSIRNPITNFEPEKKRYSFRAEKGGIELISAVLIIIIYLLAIRIAPISAIMCYKCIPCSANPYNVVNCTGNFARCAYYQGVGDGNLQIARDCTNLTNTQCLVNQNYQLFTDVIACTCNNKDFCNGDTSNFDYFSTALPNPTTTQQILTTRITSLVTTITILPATTTPQSTTNSVTTKNNNINLVTTGMTTQTTSSLAVATVTITSTQFVPINPSSSTANIPTLGTTVFIPLPSPASATTTTAAAASSRTNFIPINFSGTTKFVPIGITTLFTVSGQQSSITAQAPTTSTAQMGVATVFVTQANSQNNIQSGATTMVTLVKLFNGAQKSRGSFSLMILLANVCSVIFFFNRSRY